MADGRRVAVELFERDEQGRGVQAPKRRRAEREVHLQRENGSLREAPFDEVGKS